MRKAKTNLKYQVPFRKKLRNNATRAEIVLWSIIKNKQLDGRRFRRQFGVGKYVLDFYCPSERLAIELDGHYHYTEEGIERDKERALFYLKTKSGWSESRTRPYLNLLIRLFL